LLLYDKLRKQFDKAWKNRTNNQDNRESFYVYKFGRELHLSKRHFDDYAKAADSIITHNIWKKTLNQYIIDCGSNENISMASDNKISYKNKLCFILSLSDTLEPLKRNMSLLQDVSIRELNKGFELQMNKDTYNKIYKNIINGLEEWIDVKVRKIKPTENIVNIKIWKQDKFSNEEKKLRYLCLKKRNNKFIF